MACIFCKIVNNELPADVVFQDEKVIVFKDINPQAKTHLLVVPKEHIRSIDSVGSEDIMRDLIKVAKEIIQKNNLKDYQLIFNAGKQQIIKHLHMHLLSDDKL